MGLFQPSRLSASDAGMEWRFKTLNTLLEFAGKCVTVYTIDMIMMGESQEYFGELSFLSPWTARLSVVCEGDGELFWYNNYVIYWNRVSLGMVKYNLELE